MNAVLTGVGAALPAVVVGNDHFSRLGVTDEWIVHRTGVRQRYRLGADERLVDLATAAGAAALADSGVAADEVDSVVVATTTADRISPGLAPEVAHRLGTRAPGAVDVNGACTGFLYALDYAMLRVDAGRADCVLVVGADAMSRITDEDDRSTAVLFGDAAGAVVVRAERGARRAGCPQFLSFGSAGDHVGLLHVERDDPTVRMAGGEVYEFAVEAMAHEIRQVCHACGVRTDDLDLLVSHQANARIVRAVARRLGSPDHQVAVYLDRFGNTSAASIPLAVAEAQREGRLTPGARLGMTAFGAGLTWGAGVVNWKGCVHAVRGTDCPAPAPDASGGRSGDREHRP
ncbi:beta-ketoacyl-ACP synthase 3 [Micromonospora echinospora]|uniref:beta-ketoacyl-ACP synthase 3 n=1 Tax=Micromonospora echinospora TaxID=1877 RepID=UPI003A84F048